MSKVIMCDVKETYLETYREYEIYEIEQVELITGEPFKDGSGSKWYEMYNPNTEDKISVQQWWRVHESIDYRIKANPNMLEKMRQEVLRKREKRVA